MACADRVDARPAERAGRRSDEAMTGYLHPAYVRSLCDFGVPRRLPGSGGWLLVRPIPDSELRDAMGPYPLFACPDWSGLGEDLDDLGTDLVTIAVVPDPFGDHDLALLERCFDRVVHFKDRYVIDLGVAGGDPATSHHRYYARRAAAMVSVQLDPCPARSADDWIGLYAGLIRRRGLRGIKALTPRALSEQLAVPGIVAFRALRRGELVGMHLWYIQGPVAYSHLTALTDEGYRLGASYALHAFAIDWFAPRVRWLDLGAGSGTAPRPDDGLGRFKRGWATGTRPAYFCTRVYDREKYAMLLQARGDPPTSYFPAYREGEFA
jgi:Acetyltransferase (GNAT) domain